MVLYRVGSEIQSSDVKPLCMSASSLFALPTWIPMCLLYFSSSSTLTPKSFSRDTVSKVICLPFVHVVVSGVIVFPNMDDFSLFGIEALLPDI